MPYIKHERRCDYENDEVLEPEFHAQDAGELNFQITMIVQDYLLRKGLKYAHINDVIGALEGAKLEIYRRVAAPYEDKKIVENGDVYHKLLIGKEEI